MDIKNRKCVKNLTAHVCVFVYLSVISGLIVLASYGLSFIYK